MASRGTISASRPSPWSRPALADSALSPAPRRQGSAVRDTIRLLKVSKGAIAFYDFEEYERLVVAARDVSREAYLITLLGGEAGLRSGEMVALEWRDIDFTKRLLCVERNVWEGQVDSPKGGRIRYVPMTARLTAALRDTKHLRGPRVLYRRNGQPFSEMAIMLEGRRAARRAEVPWNGPHRLRHTFCSHLAMRGAAPRAIQELAGHAHITTTQRYMHLSPAARDEAIDLLEGAPFRSFGDGLETRQA
jgi:integrase